jgi:hypothetical protein
MTVVPFRAPPREPPTPSVGHWLAAVYVGTLLLLTITCYLLVGLTLWQAFAPSWLQPPGLPPLIGSPT